MDGLDLYDEMELNDVVLALEEKVLELRAKCDTKTEFIYSMQEEGEGIQSAISEVDELEDEILTIESTILILEQDTF